MKRYTSIIYSLGLFLGLILFVGTSFAFEDCRNKKITQSDADYKYYKGHVYTCEFSADKSRLTNYCAKDNTVSTEPGFDCPPVAGNDQLYCHICKCISGIRTEDGKCSVGEEKDSGSTTKGGGDTASTTSIATEPSLGTGQTTSTEKKDDTEVCPGGLLDSQGKCCKKSYYDLTLRATVCCEGILLSTNVPFIGQCIVFKKNGGSTPIAGLIVDEDTAFPVLMGGLSKILVSLILLVSFMGILVGGVMISASGGTDEGANKGRKIIGNVISALALLGASGVILKIINPNFFG